MFIFGFCKIETIYQMLNLQSNLLLTFVYNSTSSIHHYYFQIQLYEIVHQYYIVSNHWFPNGWLINHFSEWIFVYYYSYQFEYWFVFIHTILQWMISYNHIYISMINVILIYLKVLMIVWKLPLIKHTNKSLNLRKDSLLLT